MSSRSYGIAQSIQYVTGPGQGQAAGIFSPVYDNRGVITHLDNCILAFGRKVINYGRMAVPATYGTLYAIVKHPTYGQTIGEGLSVNPVLSIETSSRGDTNSYTSFPLYQLADGVITMSYIGMPFIPVYS